LGTKQTHYPKLSSTSRWNLQVFVIAQIKVLTLSHYFCFFVVITNAVAHNVTPYNMLKAIPLPLPVPR